jgi:phosphodiesterase/alkaline phosphatase D-like protein
MSIKETIEQAAEHYAHNWFNMHETNNYKALRDGFIAGAEWEAERMYSEEEVEIIIQKLMSDVHCGDLCYGDNVIDFKMSPKQWVSRFVNKQFKQQ